jgi:hypothetical protein
MKMLNGPFVGINLFVTAGFDVYVRFVLFFCQLATALIPKRTPIASQQQRWAGGPNNEGSQTDPGFWKMPWAKGHCPHFERAVLQS